MPHNPTHALVWLDFREAKIFLVTAADVEAQRIKAHTPTAKSITRRRRLAAAMSATTANFSKPFWPPSRTQTLG